MELRNNTCIYTDTFKIISFIHSNLKVRFIDISLITFWSTWAKSNEELLRSVYKFLSSHKMFLIAEIYRVFKTAAINLSLVS